MKPASFQAILMASLPGSKGKKYEPGGLMTTGSGWGLPRPNLHVSMVSLKGVMSETVAETAKGCRGSLIFP